jgi:hypothetical protein
VRRSALKTARHKRVNLIVFIRMLSLPMRNIGNGLAIR